MIELLVALVKFAGLMAVAAVAGIGIGAAIAATPWAKRAKRMPTADGDIAVGYGAASLDGGPGSQRMAVPRRPPNDGDDGDGTDSGDGGGD